MTEGIKSAKYCACYLGLLISIPCKYLISGFTQLPWLQMPYYKMHVLYLYFHISVCPLFISLNCVFSCLNDL